MLTLMLFITKGNLINYLSYYIPDQSLSIVMNTCFSLSLILLLIVFPLLSQSRSCDDIEKYITKQRPQKNISNNL